MQYYVPRAQNAGGVNGNTNSTCIRSMTSMREEATLSVRFSPMHRKHKEKKAEVRRRPPVIFHQCIFFLGSGGWRRLQPSERWRRSLRRPLASVPSVFPTTNDSTDDPRRATAARSNGGRTLHPTSGPSWTLSPGGVTWSMPSAFRERDGGGKTTRCRDKIRRAA